jgi:hypothetical protein
METLKTKKVSMVLHFFNENLKLCFIWNHPPQKGVEAPRSALTDGLCSQNSKRRADTSSGIFQ